MEETISVIIGNSSPANFVGEVLYEGIGENGARKKIQTIKVRGYWEKNKDKQEMTITFCAPICKWKKIDTVSNEN